MLPSRSVFAPRLFGSAIAGLLAVSFALAGPAPALAVGGETFVQLANQKRAAAGKAPLGFSQAIDRIAVERADEMARRDRLEHDMAYVSRRLSELGVCHTGVGEIIYRERGYGSFSYARAIEAWWKSDPHRAAMLGDFNGASGSWRQNSSSGWSYALMIFVKLCQPPSTSVPTTRITGADRYVGAAALSASTFSPGVPAVVLASGEHFPDALAGAPLATLYGGPVLLVRATGIPAATAAELARLKPASIIITGGTASVSNAVASAAASYTTGSVTRIGGADRYAGAANISTRFAVGRPVVYVASGEKFPDALAGAAVAGRDRTPVLLVRGNAIPAATATALNRLRPGRIAVLGGPATVSDEVLSALRAYTSGSVSRLAGGADRYSAATALSAASFSTRPVVYLATGVNFPDGLAAGAVAGRGAAPVLLVPPTHLPAEVATELRRLQPSTVIVVGGPASVSDSVLNAIRALWP